MITRLLVRPRNRLKKGINVRCYLEGSIDVTYADMKEMIKDGHRFDVDIDSYNGKFREKMLDNKETILIQIIKGLELEDIKIDLALTRRILQNGGLIEYTKKLESRVN